MTQSRKGECCIYQLKKYRDLSFNSTVWHFCLIFHENYLTVTNCDTLPADVKIHRFIEVLSGFEIIKSSVLITGPYWQVTFAKHFSPCRGASTGDTGSETTQNGTVMVDTCRYTSAQTSTMCATKSEP